MTTQTMTAAEHALRRLASARPGAAPAPAAIPGGADVIHLPPQDTTTSSLPAQTGLWDQVAAAVVSRDSLRGRGPDEITARIHDVDDLARAAAAAPGHDARVGALSEVIFAALAALVTLTGDTIAAETRLSQTLNLT